MFFLLVNIFHLENICPLDSFQMKNIYFFVNIFHFENIYISSKISTVKLFFPFENIYLSFKMSSQIPFYIFKYI